MNTDSTSWSCPRCGEKNAASARLCGLCGDIRPGTKPAPVPPASERPATWRDSAPTAPLPAPPTLPPNPAVQAPSPKVSGGSIAGFVLLFPWSLVVLLLPGGLRNRNAVRLMVALFLVGTTVALIIGLAMLGRLLESARSLVPDTSSF